VGVFFKKEAMAIRGLPDVLGVVNSKFIGLELKRNKKEMNKKGGRIVLQRLWLEKFEKEGGFARITCPENWNEIYRQLCRHCDKEIREESLLSNA